MQRLWRAILILILATQLLPCTASANSINITVTARPRVTGGITDFLITYVSDTQLDISWTLFGDATKIMIRGKYGSYPNDIPNKNTIPSDGYLVYYGDANSVSDTSMNFDENAGILYYKAWAQKADGTWYTDTSTGLEESKKMLLLFLGLLPLALLGMGYGFKKSWILWLSIPFWFMLGIYISYFQSWFANTTAQHSLILISVAASIAAGFAAVRMQMASLSNPQTNMDGDDELDDEDLEYQREAAQYQKSSNVYHTKLKPHKIRF